MDLNKLELKLDDALAKETTESLTEWMESKRKTELFYQKQVMNPYNSHYQYNSYTAYEKGFVEGWEKCQKNDDAECVNCDEVKETHQICMDCICKLIKENQENLYTEEQMVGFAEWIINQDMKLVLIHTKKSLLNEYIQSLKQK